MLLPPGNAVGREPNRTVFPFRMNGSRTRCLSRLQVLSLAALSLFGRVLQSAFIIVSSASISLLPNPAHQPLAGWIGLVLPFPSVSDDVH